MFKFQNSILNGCHDLKMFCLKLSDTAIVTKSGDYRWIVDGISKSKAISLLQNFVLVDYGYM